MAKGRERERVDNDSASAGQSKRPLPVSQYDSDSPGSGDPAQYQQQQQQQQNNNHHHQQQQSRGKNQKHAVGAARLHARVPSSKALHKHTTSASSTKLVRRITSPDAPDRTTSSSMHHKRNTSSEVKLARDSSSSNLRKNNSTTNLKKNRSHVDVTKRNKSSGQLKRSASEKAVNKLKSPKTSVHFDLGTDGQNEGPDDAQEDEWVDASSSASPYLSRRGSVNNSGQSSKVQDSGASSRPESPAEKDELTPLARPNQQDITAQQHKEYLTTRLLQRTPSLGSTTAKMSSVTASVRATGPERRLSPDSRESNSTLSTTPVQGVVGSNGKDVVTSRFIRNDSHASRGGESFFTSGDSRRPSSSRTDDGLERPRSLGNLRTSAEADDMGGSRKDVEIRGDDDLTDEEDTGITVSAAANTGRNRKSGAAVAPPAEKSRTQQKLNLQRASSSMDPVRHRHSGMGGFAAEVAEVAGPLLGGAGYDTMDPRVNKLLERTGVEYLIVRRYQNPVARSLSRLSQLPGADQVRHIPRPGASGMMSSHHTKRSSTLGAGQLGLSQSYKEARDGANGSSRQPPTPKRAYSSIRANGAGSSPDTDDGISRMHEGLSGSSLVNGEDDDGTLTILRGLWEKNIELSASQD